MTINKISAGELLELIDLFNQLEDAAKDGKLPAKRLLADLKDILNDQSFQFTGVFGPQTGSASVTAASLERKTVPPPSAYEAIIVDDTGIIVSPEEEIENILRWNKQFNLHFSENALAQCREIPEPPVGEIPALVLVPYLDDDDETFDRLYDIIAANHDQARRSEELTKRQGSLTLVDGQRHARGLVWEKIDLGANLGLDPTSLSGNRCPHAGVLAAAAHFPNWVRNLGTPGIPNVWVPGYRYQPPRKDEALVEHEAIRLGWDSGRKNLLLFTAWEGRKDRSYAVPTFIV